MRRAITISDDVMWGMPVFRGTRVLAETVAGSVQEGEPLARLKDSYAFLTEDLLEAAKTYFEIYPFQGHVTHISDSHPDWKIRSVKEIYLEKMTWPSLSTNACHRTWSRWLTKLVSMQHAREIAD